MNFIYLQNKYFHRYETSYKSSGTRIRKKKD